MTIRVYNTLSRKKEEFQPVRPGQVGIYLCGPTVYKPSHIGHMVGPVIFDVIKRYLTYSGYQVQFIVNITDVDDKLIKEAQKRGLSMSEVASEMTKDYWDNLAAVGVDTIDAFPKATEHMDAIIQLTQELIEAGYAYSVPSGDVYFEVAKDREYGKLSGRDPEQMLGEGGETAAVKRAPLDFALWKAAKPGEPSWDSPWGPGRPGWHVECSAMSRELLGKTFDIHGGGLDLQFPHHENEIAQSECCHQAPQAKYWLHNGLVQATDEIGKVGGRATRVSERNSPHPEATGLKTQTTESQTSENQLPAVGDQAAQEANKVGKSKGAQPFHELLQHHSGETVRYFVLATHYRRPITLSEDLLKDASTALETFYRYFQRFQRVTGERFYELSAPTSRADLPFDPSGDDLLTEVAELRGQILEALDDDFNTGEAIGQLQTFIRTLNRYVEAHKLEDPTASAEPKQSLRQATVVFKELTSVLGLFRAPVAQTAAPADSLVAPLMDLLISLRADLRKAKNFELADRIRSQLAELGITLEDRAGGTEWSRA